MPPGRRSPGDVTTGAPQPREPRRVQPPAPTLPAGAERRQGRPAGAPGEAPATRVASAPAMVSHRAGCSPLSPRARLGSAPLGSARPRATWSGPQADLREDVVDADDAVRAGGAAVVDDGGVALHPHPAAVLGQEAVVLGGHLPFHQHCGDKAGRASARLPPPF